MSVKYPADVNIFAVVCIDCPEHKTDPAIIQYTQDKFQKFCPLYPHFQATAEDDATLIAMMQLEQHLGKEIIWVRGKTYDQILLERYASVLEGNRKRLPSWARRYCTEEMKLLPIFEYLYYNGYTPCQMNIGFRSDEWKRIFKFYRNRNGSPKIPGPHFYHYPMSCNNFGERLQQWQDIYYRRACFPIYTDGTTKLQTRDYFKGLIYFPEISNCEGCFHKDIDIIAFKARTSPAKSRWWQKWESYGMGTWRDDRITYKTISESNLGEQLTLDTVGKECESEGCGV